MKNIFKRSAAAIITAAILTAGALPVYASTLTEENGVKYIHLDDGRVLAYTGITRDTLTGNHYYYVGGKKVTNSWLTRKRQTTERYFLTGDGTMATGKVTINGREYEFDEEGKLMSNFLSLEITASDVTPEKANLRFIFSKMPEERGDLGNCEGEILAADGTSQLIDCGSEFQIERLTKNGWETIPQTAEEYLEDDIIYVLSGFHDNARTIEWSEKYGSLKKGYYRIGLPMYYSEYGKKVEKMYYGYFRI